MGRAFTISETLLDYVQSTGVREHPVLQKCREETAAMGDVSRMQIAPEQGALLALLIKLTEATRYLEVGVFTGYSSLAVALALPEDGHITACDRDEQFVSKARTFWSAADIEHKIDVRLGKAVDTLDRLIADKVPAYDMVFIDADKGNYSNYYDRALTLVRAGGLIAVDNVLWQGRVVDPEDTSDNTEAIRALNAKVAADERVETCLVPIADGLFLCRKK